MDATTKVNSSRNGAREMLPGATTLPVGVKLLRRGDEYGEDSIERPGEPMTFCRFVHEAAAGRNFLVRLGDLSCRSAQLALGLREPLFGNIEPRIKGGVEALRVGPVKDADVVMLVLDPEQAMTVSGMLEGITTQFAKSRTVCGEGMARGYNSGRPIITFLCIGARTKGDFQSHELLLSMPQPAYLALLAKANRFRLLVKAKETLRRKVSRSAP